jgi:hypothetical protein
MEFLVMLLAGFNWEVNAIDGGGISGNCTSCIFLVCPAMRYIPVKSS